MIQQTSLLAFNQLNEVFRNNTYNSIIEVLKRWENGLTDREIAQILGYSDPNVIRPRRNELVTKGLVTKNNKRICSISGKLAITWVYPTISYGKNENIEKECYII